MVCRQRDEGGESADCTLSGAWRCHLTLVLYFSVVAQQSSVQVERSLRRPAPKALLGCLLCICCRLHSVIQVMLRCWARVSATGRWSEHWACLCWIPAFSRCSTCCMWAICLVFTSLDILFQGAILPTWGQPGFAAHYSLAQAPPIESAPVGNDILQCYAAFRAVPEPDYPKDGLHACHGILKQL